MFYRLALLMLVAVLFMAGFNKLSNVPGTAKYLQGLPNLQFVLKQAQLAKLMKPEYYTHLATAVGVTETLLPTLVVVGIMRRFAAFLLAGFMIFATVLGHLTLPDVKKTPQSEKIEVLKNLAICGGLLLVVFAPSAPRKVKRD